MKSISIVLSAALAATSVFARIYTTTLPYEDGNTLAIEVTTDALGDLLTETISTITATGTTTTSPVGQLTTTTSSTTRTRATTRTTATTTTGPVTTTGQRVVGVDTTAPPMRTTTYWYDPGDGVWVEATWTASITAAPQVATVIVPAGTIQNYDSYQRVVNSVVLASAEAAIATGTGGTSGGAKVHDGTARWAAVAIGVIGAGLGALAL